VPALIVVAALMIVVNIGLSGLAFSIEQRLRRTRRSPLEAATIEQEGAPGAAVAQAH
jgi:glutamate transport system permease protein